MAEIQIVYRKPLCDYDVVREFNTQCFTCVAGDSGCKYYSDGGRKIDKEGHVVIPTGACSRARWTYGYKGWSGANYHMEELNDPYNPWLDSMEVKLGRTTYDCVKVTLDGKVIYNNYDDENEEAAK